MPFGQVIVGPPGSGKSTYCDGMSQLLTGLNRPCSIINLDPANENFHYECAIDVRDLITLEDIMKDDELGPNGGILQALDTVVENWDWMEDKIKGLNDDYIIIDCPGQAEVFTHHHSLWEILHRLEVNLGYRLTALHLVDSQALTRPSLYISTLLLGIRTQLHLGLPHLNVFTKIDLLASYEPLPLPLHFYTDASPLTPILPFLALDFAPQRRRRRSAAAPSEQVEKRNDDNEEEDVSPAPKPSALSTRFEKLNTAIVDLVEDYPMGYETLAVEDKKSMAWLLRQIDRAGGYAYGGAEGANEGVWETVATERGEVMDVRDVEQRWITQRTAYDEWEAKQKEAEKRELEAQGAGSSEIVEKDDDMGMDDDELVEYMRLREEKGGVKVVRVNKPTNEATKP